VLLLQVGPFAEAWKAASTAAGVEIVDVTTPLSLLLAVKDKEEVELMRTAAMATNRVSGLCYSLSVHCFVVQTLTHVCQLLRNTAGC
jgi:nucleosome binding factor SPN SPT16 subunit